MSEPTDKPADDTALTAEPTTALPDDGLQEGRRPKPQVGATGHKVGLGIELEQ